LVLSDFNLGSDVDGLAIIQRARQMAPGTKTIMMSGKSSGERAVPSHTNFIEKPVIFDKLSKALAIVTRQPG